MVTELTKAIKIFICYAPKDEKSATDLIDHLELLRRSGSIEIWDKKQFYAGASLDRETNESLNSSDIILLIISKYFMASPHCSSIRKYSEEKHKAGTARVIPILLSPIDLGPDLFLKSLMPLPVGGRPITTWANRDNAFVDVVKGIGKIVEKLLNQRAGTYKAFTDRRTIDTHAAINLFHRFMEEPEGSGSDLYSRIFYLTGEKDMGKTHLLEVFSIIAKHTYSARHATINFNEPLFSVPDVLDAICTKLGPNDYSTYSHSLQETMKETGFDPENIGNTAYQGFPARETMTIEKKNNHLTKALMKDLSRLKGKSLLFFFDHIDKAIMPIQKWLIDSFFKEVSSSSLPHLHMHIVVARELLPEIPPNDKDRYQIHQLTSVKDEEEFITFCQHKQLLIGEPEIVKVIEGASGRPGLFIKDLFTKVSQQEV